jgi:hypothetical protein
MAMSDVLQLVADITDGLADQTNAQQIYADLWLELGRDSSWTCVNIQAFGAVAGQADYAPVNFGVTDVIDILSVLYDGRHLAHSDVVEAKYYDRYFRTTKGSPRVWLEQDEPREGFQLMPIPSRSGTGGVAYDPVTTAGAEGDIVLVYTRNTVNGAFHQEEELAVALEIVAREMSRDSDHTDKTLAQVARTLSGMLFQIVGIGNTLAGLDETSAMVAEPTPAGAE